MDFKNVTFYPDFWVDLLVYIVVAGLLIFLSKWLWDKKEARRLKKEMAAYQQRKDDEMQGEDIS